MDFFGSITGGSCVMPNLCRFFFSLIFWTKYGAYHILPCKQMATLDHLICEALVLAHGDGRRRIVPSRNDNHAMSLWSTIINMLSMLYNTCT